MCSDVVVLVGGCAAVAARVVVGDAPDDQITARQQGVLLVPEETGSLSSAFLSTLLSPVGKP